MSKTIKSLSVDYEAVPVPVRMDFEQDGLWLRPGESCVISDVQASSHSLKLHEDAGRVVVSDSNGCKLVENISDVVVYFEVPELLHVSNRQLVFPPNGELTITDEQAASPGMKEFIESGRGDDPDDEFKVQGGSGKVYKTVSEAISAGESKIRLLSDIAGRVTIASGKSVEIDLNGKSVRSSSSAFRVAGELVIKGNGSVVSTRDCSIGLANGGKVSILGGSYEGVEGCVSFPGTVGCVAIIEGGEFVSSDNAVILLNGSEQYGGNRVEVNGGVFHGRIKTAGYIACGIYCPNDDVIVVNGGDFHIENGCGICSRAGKVEVSGGAFECTGDAVGKVGDSRVVVPCSAIVFDSQAAYPKLKEDSVIGVSGGKFVSDADAVSHVGDPSHVSISGGLFSSRVPDDCCADGYAPSDADDDGMYTVNPV